MDNIKENLEKAINQIDVRYFHLHNELNNELIYQTIYDNYFKNLTVEDIKSFVNISYSTVEDDRRCETRTASIYLKMILHFTKSKRIEILNDFIDKFNLEK